MFRWLQNVCMRCGKPVHRSLHVCLFCGYNLAHETAAEIEPEQCEEEDPVAA